MLIYMITLIPPPFFLSTNNKPYLFLKLQVINHGVSEDLMDETMNVAEEFHAMPGLDKERECSKDPNGSCKLYTSSYVYPREDFHYWRDAVTHPCRPLVECIQFWPEKPTRYR